jgi:hypothetical protein
MPTSPLVRRSACATAGSAPRSRRWKGDGGANEREPVPRTVAEVIGRLESRLESGPWRIRHRGGVVCCDRQVRVKRFVNAALKVRDVGEARAWFERIGAEVGPIETWRGSRRADVRLAGVLVTLFERALYEDRVALPEESFLHLVFAVDDLDAALEGQQVVWGPEVVEGSFGRRRIAFVEAPGNVRVEFMVELDPKPS